MDRVNHALAALAELFRAALPIIREPGFADRAGALAIGVFVLACWLFALSPGRPKEH